MKLVHPALIRQIPALLQTSSAQKKKSRLSGLREIFCYSLWPPETKRLFLLNVGFGFLLLLILELMPLCKLGQNMINENHDFLIAESFKENAIKGRAAHKDIKLLLLDRTFYESSPGMGYWTPKLRLLETVDFALGCGAREILIDCRMDRPVPLEKENLQFMSAFRKTLELARQKNAVIIIPRLAGERGLALTEFSKKFWNLTEDFPDVVKIGDAGIIRNPEDKRIRHLRYYRAEDKGSGDEILLSVAMLAAVYANGTKEGDIHRDRIVNSIRDIEAGKTERQRVKLFKGTDITLFRQENGSDDIEARLKFSLAPKDIYLRKTGAVSAGLLSHTSSATGIRYADPASLAGKIVIIGSDYEEIGDMHLTPIGRMPGVYIIANAVNMFLNGDQVHSDAVISYVIKILTVLLVSLGVAHLPAIFDLLLLVLAFFIFHPLSIYLFMNYGLFFNFLLLLAGISFFDYVNNVSEYLIERVATRERT
ncbi:CHASE2 domain-containing protein [Maridesulfovibrio sp.]|uniref:CHASE2 domain-containing protein n=1 Tax=Maridesulfovibrio sp. TaxID=2795000 RepID=UPI002A18D39F|nr:CHASE2 domain-containing protein [Maridesulfovibrio sp.]